MDDKKPTHLATVQQRPLTPIETVKQDLYKDINKFAVYFNGNKEDADRFALASYEYVRRVPKLLTVGRESLLMAFVQAAQFRFLPAGVNGEAYIIPYGNEAKFQLGYQGIVTLLYRAGVLAITSNIVYANDTFEYEEGLEAKLVHKPTPFGKDKGEAVGVYTVAQLPGGAKTFKVMDKAAVMGIKALSKAKDSKESPWNSNLDPEKWMWRKTCLLQHSKFLPKTPDLQRAMEVDFEGEGIDKPRIDPAGPAVGKSFHEPDKTLPPTAPAAAAAEGKKCPAGKHPDDKMATGECEYCTEESYAQQHPDEGKTIQA